jgi:hypothetical protein
MTDEQPVKLKRTDTNGGVSRTSHVSRLRQSLSQHAADEVTPNRLSQRVVEHSLKKTLFPQNSCLFCGKEKKWVCGKHSAETLVTCLTETAESTIKECAKVKNDSPPW